MKITVLVENTSRSPALRNEHGLSIHVESGPRRILMDFGPSDALVPNAAALGIDLAAVDFGVLSHGHSDHSGGIPAFLAANRTAPIYVQERALAWYGWVEPDGSYVYGGLDESLKTEPRLRRCSGVTDLGQGAVLFDGITGRELYSEANRCLLEKTADGYRQDAFAHEQALILPAGSGYVLLGGCAHNGIVNIIEKAKAIMGKAPAAVLSGFHLADPDTGFGYDPELVDALAERLLQTPTKYYTCHRTGLEAYARLKRRMGEAVDYAAAGDVIEI